MKPNLQEKAFEIYKFALERDLELNPIWVPREENKLADEASRIGDPEDWQLEDWAFNEIVKLYGVLTVDRFASHKSKKLLRFNR